MPPGVWNQSWSTWTATLVTAGRPDGRQPGSCPTSLSHVAPADRARDAGPDERRALGQAPGPLDVAARLQRAEAGRLQAPGEDPRVGVRALLEKVPLEGDEDRSLLLGREPLRELEPSLHGSERDVAVLARRHRLALGGQDAERPHEPRSRLGGLDHVVDVP